jgi:nucleoside-diphosphate-sugar epimerase
MTTVLITGATGFVGSAIASNLLVAGYDILALSRNDSDGERTRRSVRDAAAGFGKPLDEAAEQRLTVIEANPDQLETVLTCERLSGVCAAWHVAAEMSYARQKVLSSYHTNVGLTTQLYRLLASRAPQCKRFFYVSTAYTGGMDGGLVEEVLHAGLPYDNVYQLTKCFAEHALVHNQAQAGLPVTLFRPTIVVGHTSSGWARRNGFGLHMFFEAIAKMGHIDIAEVWFNLNAATHPDLIPIDRLASDAVVLTTRAALGAMVEICHCAGGRGLTLDSMLRTIGRSCGVAVHFGPLKSAADKSIDRAIDPNRRFASTDWLFSSRNLERLLGHEPRPPVSESQLEKMVRWYLTDGTEVQQRRLGLVSARNSAMSTEPLVAESL